MSYYADEEEEWLPHEPSTPRPSSGSWRGEEEAARLALASRRVLSRGIAVPKPQADVRLETPMQLEEETTKRKTYSALVRGPPFEHRRVREVISRRGVSAVATVMSRASPPPFCYLEPTREGASPYSLTLSREKPTTSNYAIISRAGLLRVNGAGETESCQAKEEMKERALFSRLQQIPFFKTFGRWKPFVVWKRATRRLKYLRAMFGVQRSRCMEVSIVSGHNGLRNELLALDLLYQSRSIITPEQLYEQQKLVNRRAAQCVAAVAGKSATFLVSLADRLTIAALKDMPEVQSAAREEVLISGILAPSFSVEALSFTERGVIRKVLQDVHAFARLVEFQQRSALAKNLELALASFDPPLLLELVPDGGLTPSREATLASVQAALHLSLDAAASSVALLTQPAVRSIFAHAELPQPEEPLADIVRCPEMHQPSGAQNAVNTVLAQLENNFDSLFISLRSPQIVSLVEICQRQHSFSSTYSLERLISEDMDVDLLRQLLESNALDKDAVQSQPHTVTVGSISVSTTVALTCAMESLNACRNHLEATLPALFVHKAKLLCDEMSSLSSRLAQGLQSSSVEEFVDAVDLYALTIDGKWRLSCSFDEVTSMINIFFEDYNVAQTDESVAYSRTIHSAWRDFENSLDSFSAAVGRESKARIGEVERRARLLTTDLDGVLSFIQGQGNPSSDPADVLAAIERFTARAAALTDRAVELDRLQKALDADAIRLEPFLRVNEKMASTKILWSTKARLEQHKAAIFPLNWAVWLLAEGGDDLHSLLEDVEESISTHCVPRLHRELESAVSRTIDELKAVATAASIIKAGEEEPSDRLRAVLGAVDLTDNKSLETNVRDVARALLQPHVSDLLRELTEE